MFFFEKFFVWIQDIFFSSTEAASKVLCLRISGNVCIRKTDSFYHCMPSVVAGF